MTKEEFENEILLNVYDMDFYENAQIYKDVYLYYDFKIVVDLISKTLHEQYNKKIFGKGRIAELIESADKIKNMLHDETIEFKFLDDVKNKDMDVIFSYLNGKSARNLYSGALRRLYNYHDYKLCSIEDILSKVDEIDYVLALEKKDKGKFDIWCENHPDVNIEEEKAKRSAKQL